MQAFLIIILFAILAIATPQESIQQSGQVTLFDAVSTTSSPSNIQFTSPACWLNAIQSIDQLMPSPQNSILLTPGHSTCSSMTDTNRKHLALELTTCFITDSDREMSNPQIWDTNYPYSSFIKSSLKTLSNTELLIFNSFHIHVHSLCKGLTEEVALAYHRDTMEKMEAASREHHEFSLKTLQFAELTAELASAMPEILGGLVKNEEIIMMKEDMNQYHMLVLDREKEYQEMLSGVTWSQDVLTSLGYVVVLNVLWILTCLDKTKRARPFVIAIALFGGMGEAAFYYFGQDLVQMALITDILFILRLGICVVETVIILGVAAYSSWCGTRDGGIIESEHLLVDRMNALVGHLKQVEQKNQMQQTNLIIQQMNQLKEDVKNMSPYTALMRDSTYPAGRGISTESPLRETLPELMQTPGSTIRSQNEMPHLMQSYVSTVESKREVMGSSTINTERQIIPSSWIKSKYEDIEANEEEEFLTPLNLLDILEKEVHSSKAKDLITRERKRVMEQETRTRKRRKVC